MIEMEDAATFIERVNIPNSLRTVGPFLEEAQSLLRLAVIIVRNNFIFTDLVFFDPQIKLFPTDKRPREIRRLLSFA